MDRLEVAKSGVSTKPRSSEKRVRAGSSSAVLPSALFNGAWTCLQHCSVGLAYASRELRLIYCNPAFATFCNKPADELIDKHIRDILPGCPDVARSRSSVDDIVWSGTIQNHSGSGELLYMSLKEIKDVGASGYLLKIQPGPVQTPPEFTGRQNVSSYEGRDQFLAVLEHELRSPLTPIMAWIEVLKQEPSQSSGLHRAIHAIERNVLHQRALVENLLDLASIRAGKLECERVPVSIQSVLTESISRYQPRAREKGAVLDFKFSAADLLVLGDRERLGQICDNLLDNAVKFTPSGGRIEARLSSNGDWVRIDIADTGCGIAPEFIGDLFKTFAQGHDLASRHRRGLGLGLAIVKNLVERHLGRIEASSAGENSGATFSVHLPIYVPGVGEIATPADASRPGKILIVEDHDDTREALRTLLESWGLAVAEAAEGTVGLERVERFNPDIVLCDLSMPIMDGWTMASEIRAKFPTRQLPLIAMSGHGGPPDVQHSYACGFQAHLVKPCEARSLVAVLNRFLPASAVKINASESV